ncbi:MAG: hypothetical protein ACJAYY_002167 [Paraglaciecola sp.]|jgi:hypothetical protein|uniref:hypothetical protein n=1 Tax=Polaribacter sp. TaxID=1920175 RepID=UPI003EE8C9E7
MSAAEINNDAYVAFLNAVLSNGATEIISVTMGSKCDKRFIKGLATSTYNYK